MRKNSKNKITSDVHRMIIARCSELPVTYKTDRSGNPLYKMGSCDGSEIKGLDKDGNRPIAGVRYSANVLQYENHYDNLISAYKADGMTGFNEYVTRIERLQQERRKFVSDAQPWWIKLVSFFKFWKS